MSGGLIDDLQAAAARMGLPPLEFHTPLAQRIQAGDVQDLVTGYMDLLAEYQATRVWFLDVLDAAFEAGWTRRPGIHHGLPLDPPAGTDTPWIKLAAIDPGNLTSVKRFAGKLCRAGVTVPEPPTAQAAA